MTATQTFRVDGAVYSLALKSPCVAVSNANLTLSGEQTVNSIAVVEEDRVLVKDQTDTTENGIYVVETGAWGRAKDFDGNRDIVDGTLVTVAKTTGMNFFYQVDGTDPIVIGTSAIAFLLASDPNVSYPIIQPEIDASLTTDDIDDSYKPGVILRYGTNTTPGTTDMLAAWQASVNQAEQGGAKVDLAQQNILVTGALKITTGNLVMDMRGATITSSGSFTGGDADDSAIINIRGLVSQVQNVSIFGGKIVGPVSSGEAWGIHVSWAKNIWINGVRVEDAENAGIRVDGYGETWGNLDHINSRDEGFTSYVTVKDCYVKNTTAGSGIELIADPTHCHIYDNDIDTCVVNGLRIALAAFSHIHDNNIQDTGNNTKSLYVAGRGNDVHDNEISGKNSSGGGVVTGIYLAGSVVDSLIEDNIIRDVSGSAIDGATSDDGTHTVSRTTIRGNKCFDWGTTAEWGIIIRGADSDGNTIELNELHSSVSTIRGINVQADTGRAPKRNVVRFNTIDVPSTLITVSGRSNRNYGNIDYTSMRVTDNPGLDEFYDTDVPTAGTFELAQMVRDSSPSASNPWGWVCTQAGTQGTLSSVTGDITNGTPDLVVNDSSNLEVRDRITIAGVSGILTIIAISGTAVTLSGNADATVSTAAVAYSNAVFKASSNVAA